MTDRTCSEAGCSAKPEARELCGKHLQRFYRARRRKAKACEACGSEFVPQWDGTKYCSPKCRGMSRPSGYQAGRPSSSRQSAFAGSFMRQDWPALLAAIQGRTESVGDCWVWTGRLDPQGYPRLTIGGRPMGVHRLAAMASRGEPISTGLQVHHRCANTACCNPEHLQVVTAAENMAEMHDRHRLLRRIQALEAALADVDPSHPLLFVA